MQHLAAYFYTDGGLIASTRETHLQRDFDTLADLFDRVGLQNNVTKMVSMACQPCCTLGGRLVEAYGLRMTGGEISFQDRLCQRVRCPDCNVDLEARSLEAH